MAQCSLCSRAVAAAGAIAGALASRDATAALRLVLAALVWVARACNERYWSKICGAGVPLHAVQIFSHMGSARLTWSSSHCMQ